MGRNGGLVSFVISGVFCPIQGGFVIQIGGFFGHKKGFVHPDPSPASNCSEIPLKTHFCGCSSFFLQAWSLGSWAWSWRNG